MLDTNESFEESEDLKEIDDSSDDDSNDSTDLALEKENTASTARNANGKGLAARKMLEEYREERALRKAIYDDLYGYDEEE